MLRLLGNIHDLWHACLHAISHLVLRNTRDSLGAAEFLGLDAIQVIERIEALAAQRTAHAFGVGHIEHRIALGPTLHALKHAGQKAAAEGVLAAIGLYAAGDERHEAR